jgi:hypothetical protein
VACKENHAVYVSIITPIRKTGGWFAVSLSPYVY